MIWWLHRGGPEAPARTVGAAFLWRGLPPLQGERQRHRADPRWILRALIAGLVFAALADIRWSRSPAPRPPAAAPAAATIVGASARRSGDGDGIDIQVRLRNAGPAAIRHLRVGSGGGGGGDDAVRNLNLPAGGEATATLRIAAAMAAGPVDIVLEPAQPGGSEEQLSLDLGPLSPLPVAMHGSCAPHIGWALDAGSGVSVTVGGDGDDRGLAVICGTETAPPGQPALVLAPPSADTVVRALPLLPPLGLARFDLTAADGSSLVRRQPVPEGPGGIVTVRLPLDDPAVRRDPGFPLFLHRLLQHAAGRPLVDPVVTAAPARPAVPASGAAPLPLWRWIAGMALVLILADGLTGLRRPRAAS